MIVKRSPEFWHRFYMDLAARVALLSKDPDRKVGSVLVTADRRQLSTGYNGFPANVPDDLALLYDKEEKNRLMVHAEHNCIVQAPFCTMGCTLYVTRFPCLTCAKLIASDRLGMVVAPRPDFGHLRWGESWMQAMGEMKRAGVKIELMEVGG